MLQSESDAFEMEGKATLPRAKSGASLLRPVLLNPLHCDLSLWGPSDIASWAM